MRPSAPAAVSAAFERTKLVLFKPFEMGKWFTLGFCAWLASLDAEGFNIPGLGRYRVGSGGSGGNTGPNWHEIIDFIQRNLVPVVAGVSAVLILLCALWMLLVWISSRAIFMFIDGIVRNRGAVSEPWTGYRAEGNSLFWFRMVFAGLVLPALLLAVTPSVVIAWGDITQGHMTEASAVAILVALALGIPVLLVTSLIHYLLLPHFIVPIMYLRRVPCMAAWSVFRREMLPGKAGAIVVYFLLLLALSVAAGILIAGALLVTCGLVCCCVWIPYVGTVLLLPVAVFFQSYSLCFIDSMGPEWNVFADDDHQCPTCGYDLRGNVSGFCPECGAAVPETARTELPAELPPEFPSGPAV